MDPAREIQVPEGWPEEDRVGWNAAFKAGDPFDDCGPGAHLADVTRQVFRSQYGLPQIPRSPTS
jgi:hypothetical protein